MKTLFTLGLPGSFDFWNPPAAVLGQAQAAVPTGSLTEAQHTDILARLKAAVAKAQEIDDWIYSVGDQQSVVLGDSYIQFRQYIDFLSGLALDVFPDYQRIDTTNIEEWWIPDFDAWKIEKFFTTIDQAYQIFAAKVKRIYPQVPVVNAVPVISQPSPLPSRTPGAPAVTPRPTSSGIMPAPKILGIPSNTLLVGGGVAVGLGILLYALS